MFALRYRPQEGNLADTIPHFHAGEYHIFYLHGGIGYVPWEHIVTTDFLHWRELPPALLSDGEPESFDGFNMYTGCVVEQGGQWRIFYTGCNPNHPHHREFVCEATSADGVSWTKHPELAFTADGVHYDLTRELDFRDPYVFWNEEEQLWWMLLCARRAGDREPVTGLAISKDLQHWEQRAPLCDGYVGTPECPDIFRIDGTWYLLISPCDGVTTYRSAPSLAGPWSPAPGTPIDTAILYAAKRMFDGQRHVLTGWLRDLEPQSDAGDFRWGGTQCIPREVFEIAPGELGFRPVPEVRAAFTQIFHDQNLPLEIGKVPLSLEVPDDYRLDLLVDLSRVDKFILGLRTGAGGYRLIVYPRRREIEVTGTVKTPPRRVNFEFGQPIRIEAFVVDSLIEVFVNEQAAFSFRAYDFTSGALEISTSGHTAMIHYLEVNSIPSGPSDEA